MFNPPAVTRSGGLNYSDMENLFEKAIKTYLDSRAAEDPQFAEKYANPKKSISQCCDYIVSEVEKSGRKGFADEEVYGLAVHYYDEENIDVQKGKAARVIVNHTVDLTDEEKAKAREEAIKSYQAKVIEDMKRPKTTPKKDDSVLPNQMELFQ